MNLGQKFFLPFFPYLDVLRLNYMKFFPKIKKFFQKSVDKFLKYVIL